MSRIVLFMLLMSFTPRLIFAGEGDYSVRNISPVLLKNANAVLRHEQIQFQVKSVTETVLRNHYVITILNENGDSWAQFSEYYDKHSRIVSAEGILYDAGGKIIKRIKRKDFEDVSGVSGGSLMDDNRIRRHNFHHRSYPYTVEYTCEKVTESSLFFPRWIPQGGERLAVEASSMEMICRPDYTFRYKSFNYEREPVITEDKQMRKAVWSVKNLPAIVREPLAPRWHELTTMVLFAPTDFQIDNYKGKMTSWRDFGKFVFALNAHRDQLPESVKQTVRKLIEGLDDPVERISRLYRYMQENTRYISIQLGIGGWQPFSASEVADKGYGDCKALTNYMYSLLKEASIPSYYTLVRAGRGQNYLTVDFPSQQFNHVILCVPLQNDTIWLECTSQTLKAGYLSDFTCDRFALMIDAEGGRLVKTPVYGTNENTQVRKLSAAILGSGASTTFQSPIVIIMFDCRRDINPILYRQARRTDEILISVTVHGPVVRKE